MFQFCPRVQFLEKGAYLKEKKKVSGTPSGMMASG